MLKWEWCIMDFREQLDNLALESEMIMEEGYWNYVEHLACL